MKGNEWPFDLERYYFCICLITSRFTMISYRYEIRAFLIVKLQIKIFAPFYRGFLSFTRFRNRSYYLSNGSHARELHQSRFFDFINLVSAKTCLGDRAALFPAWRIKLYFALR